MSESVEQAARRVFAVARKCEPIPVSLALALLGLRNALDASDE